MVELRIDHPRIGCGTRRFVVLAIGRKWVLLFHAPTLHQLKVARGCAVTSVNFKPPIVSKIIRRNLGVADRHGLRHSPRAAKLALSAIRGQGAEVAP
jgi:hypothetical protein